MMTIPGVDPGALELLLTEELGTPHRLVSSVALGESTRAAPWQIETASNGEVHRYLVRFGESVSPHEVAALEAMAAHPIPTPHVLFWDETGDRLGTPMFVSEFIEGIPLLPAMVAGEPWAHDLYIDTVCALQAIGEDQLPNGTADVLGAGVSIRDIIDTAHRRFQNREPLHEQAYETLLATQPQVPEPEFSNGDLWPENLLVRDRRLVGVIDWQHAGCSDPLFEFLLPFFLVPELRGQGIEARYCERKGLDPNLLGWYHGVEFFDSLSIVLKTGQPYEQHTDQSLTDDLRSWLEGT